MPIYRICTLSSIKHD
eukprot:UN16090